MNNFLTYEKIKEFYIAGLFSKADVQAAVKKGIITAVEAESIINPR